MKENRSSLALYAAAFIQMVGVGLIVALLPSKVIALSGSMANVGLIASAFAVPFILLQLPVGNLGDRFGHKRFLVAGYVIAGLTGFLYFKAESVNSLLLGRVLQGFAEIPVWALAPALLSILFAESKGEAIGRYNASIHLGLTAGSLLSVYVYSVWSGNEAFLLYALSGLMGAVIIATLVRGPDLGESLAPGRGAGFREVFHAMSKISRPAIHGGVIIYGAFYGIFLTVIPAVLLSVKGFSQSEVGAFFALFYIAISISQVAAGKVADKAGPNPAIFAGLLLVAAGVSAFMFFGGIAVLVMLFVASFGLGMFCVSAMVLLNEAVPVSLKGSVSGVFYLLWGIGFFLAPPLISRLGDAWGYNTIFLICAAVVMAEMGAFSISRKTP